MHRRQPLPRLWMMTDERQGEDLWKALERLPRGSGIVFRHYSLGTKDRRRLFDRVKRVAKERSLVLMLAGPPGCAAAWGADGSHGWEGATQPGFPRSLSVHDAEEMERANRIGADLAFVSPVFPTRSHPGRKELGPEGLAAIAARARMPIIALGGMNEARAKDLARFGIYGWAAIDAWTA